MVIQSQCLKINLVITLLLFKNVTLSLIYVMIEIINHDFKYIFGLYFRFRTSPGEQYANIAKLYGLDFQPAIVQQSFKYVAMLIFLKFY